VSPHWKEDPKYGSADVHIGHRKSATSEPAGTSANRRHQVADVDVVKNGSVVTTIKLSPPPWWLNLSVFSSLSVAVS